PQYQCKLHPKPRPAPEWVSRPPTAAPKQLKVLRPHAAKAPDSKSSRCLCQKRRQESAPTPTDRPPGARGSTQTRLRLRRELRPQVSPSPRLPNRPMAVPIYDDEGK